MIWGFLTSRREGGNWPSISKGEDRGGEGSSRPSAERKGSSMEPLRVPSVKEGKRGG